MSLQIEPLDANTDFTDAKSSAQWVVGSGQTIYWRQCFIWEYKSENADFPIKKYDTCDGKAIVPAGTELYIGGKGGVVKMS
ncbi:hypothetical protein FJTKL_04923 [Diaporthe vaccinii]|uniref:Uncharacterized protein n=1 Tax=Diaporthe vaccinii TaxID=105482 RepID=A0ABR4DRV9_9PEZI